MVAKAKSAAQRTAKAVRGQVAQRKHKKWTTLTFKYPETQKTPKSPKYPKKSVASKTKLDKFNIISQPLATEKALKIIEDRNTLVFLCDPRADKKQIKQAAEELYNISVVKVNTLIRPDCRKKAFVKVSPDYEALDIANKIGII